MQNEYLLTLNMLSYLYGYKKVEILKYLAKNVDENLIFRGTYKDIMEATNASKPTVVSLFKDLKNIHLLKKEKNGLYRLNQKLNPKFAIENANLS